MKIYQQALLSKILWYKIGGVAKYVLEIEEEKDVQQAVDFLLKNAVSRYLVAGLGANLLVADNFFDGALLRMVSSSDKKGIIVENKTITAFAGELLDNVIYAGFSHNLVGLSWAGGLPSTTGGAIRGNVGAFGQEIQDCVKQIKVFDTKTNELRVLTKEEIGFSYRTSIIKQQQNLIVVSATFVLENATAEVLAKEKEIYRSRIYYRKTNHPLDYPSCGSTFKNIKDTEQVKKVLAVFPELLENVTNKWHGKVAVGSLIAKLGFSGYQIGNAKVSEKHANFILNLGGAAFVDACGIIQRIQEKFQAVFGFTPELEVQIID